MARSKRSLDDLEYNVYKKDAGKLSDSGSDNNGSSGCAVIFAALVFFMIIVVLVLSVLQNNSATSAHCAYPGCSRTPASSSSYCWLHKSTYSSGTRRRNRNNDEEEEKDDEKDYTHSGNGGSIFDSSAGKESNDMGQNGSVMN